MPARALKQQSGKSVEVAQLFGKSMGKRALLEDVDSRLLELQLFKSGSTEALTHPALTCVNKPKMAYKLS